MVEDGWLITCGFTDFRVNCDGSHLTGSRLKLKVPYLPLPHPSILSFHTGPLLFTVWRVLCFSPATATGTNHSAIMRHAIIHPPLLEKSLLFSLSPCHPTPLLILRQPTPSHLPSFCSRPFSYCYKTTLPSDSIIQRAGSKEDARASSADLGWGPDLLVSPRNPGLLSHNEKRVTQTAGLCVCLSEYRWV